MATQQPRSPARELIGDVAPKLVDLTEQVLFGDIWERPDLSKRDRSLITVACLVALNRTDQLRSHLKRALANGLTKDEIIELMTHLALLEKTDLGELAAESGSPAFNGNRTVHAEA